MQIQCPRGFSTKRWFVSKKFKKQILLPEKAGENGVFAGVWNLAEGGDQFGGPTRPRIPIVDKLRLMRRCGFSGYEAHDTEVTPEMVPIIRNYADSLGLKCGMYTPSFFTDVLYKDGAITGDDATFDRALEQAKTAMDNAVLLGAEVLVLWIAREGRETAL